MTDPTPRHINIRRIQAPLPRANSSSATVVDTDSQRGGVGGRKVAIDSPLSASASASPAPLSSDSPSGIGSKRTIRKKVTLGLGLANSAAVGDSTPLPRAIAVAVTAPPSVAAASSPSAGLGSQRSIKGSALASERLRVRGGGVGVGASPRSKPQSSPSSHQVGDAPMEPLSPNLGAAAADARDDGTSNSPDGTDSRREHDRRFKPRMAGGGAGAAPRSSMTSGALRGARMDDGSGLAPEYQELVARNQFLWSDAHFVTKHSDQAWNYYCAHQRQAFLHREPRHQHMDQAALTKLANDVVERTMQIQREHIAATNPKFNAQQVEEALMQELPHTRIGAGVPKKRTPAAPVTTADGTAAAPASGVAGLGGHIDAIFRSAPHPIEVKDLKAHVQNLLRVELDHDRDKRISKTDFLMRLKPVLTRLQTIDKPSKDICVIL